MIKVICKISTKAIIIEEIAVERRNIEIMEKLKLRLEIEDNI